MKIYKQFINELVGNIPLISIFACHNIDINYFQKNLKTIGINNYLDFYPTINECYINWNLNQHHWTTNYVWNQVIPKIFKILNFNILDNDFKLIKNTINLNNVDYHEYTQLSKFKFISLDTNYSIVNTHHYLRDFDNRVLTSVEFTGYHKLFIGAHQNCLIENLSSTNNIKLLMICDSMSIPIIPILIPYVKQILCIDNRTNKKLKNIIIDYKPTHWILCLYASFINFQVNNILFRF